MLSMTICAECGNRVHTAPGFCSFCGEVFQAAVISRQVAPSELQHQEEMKRYARIAGGVTVTPPACRIVGPSERLAGLASTLLGDRSQHVAALARSVYKMVA